MKKLKSIGMAVIALCLSTTLVAQKDSITATNKGSWMAGGTSGFNLGYAGRSLGATGSLFLDPTIAYFPVKNLAIGAKPFLHTYFSKTYNEVGGKVMITSLKYGINPFVRKYFGKGKVKPYIQGEVGVGGFSLLYPGHPNLNKFAINGGAAVGVSWFLNNYVALDLNLSYNVGRGFGSAYNPIQMNGSINIGAVFFFNRFPKKKTAANPNFRP